MKDAAHKSAVQLLKLPLAAIILGFAVAAAIVAGGYYYLEQQKKNDVISMRALQSAQVRVANANKEAEDLRGSVGIYQQMVAYGVFNPENRLDWIETINKLKAHYKLISVEYDLNPQRAILNTGKRSYPSIEVMGSQVTLRLKAFHDGDLVGFLGDLANLGKGFYPMDHCAMRLLAPVQGNPLAPRIEANCTFDWVTLKDKRVSVVASGQGIR